MGSEKAHQLLGHLNVLYVEDERLIAEVMMAALKRFFQKITYAENGIKGISAFEREKPDLVITDIRMPEMDGIEMSEKIRTLDSSIPIIVTSAHNDESFLHRAIELNINEYMVKPINTKKMLEKLERIGESLRDRELAEMYRQEQLAKALNQTEQHTIRDIGNALPLPFLLADGNRIVHLNHPFAKIIDSDQMERLNVSSQLKTLDELFLKRKGCVRSLTSISDSPAKVVLKKGENVNFYQVTLHSVPLQAEKKSLRLYAFYDITDMEKQRLMIEYQKNKLENLNELLSGHYYHQLTQSRKEKDVNETVSPAETIPPEKPLEDSVNFADTMLEEEGRDILRRSHKHKTTAEEYVAEIGNELVDEVVELRYTENEIREALDRFVAFKEGAEIREAGIHLKRFASTIHSLIEFADLATAIQILGDFLAGLEDVLVENSEKKLLLYMHNILDDLTQWRTQIFENPTALDIHYLDSSLFSSCLQFQLEFSSREDSAGGHEGEEDLGLELF